MKLFKILITSLLISFLIITIALASFALYRYISFEQTDNPEHILAKRNYLKQISESSPNLDSAPNIIFILYDDMGYGDIGAGVTNADTIQTPNIDALADNGIVLSDFHSPSPVCTPSRAAYLTGRLAPRAGMPNVVMPSGTLNEFIISKLMNPTDNIRLPEEEITLAEVLKAAGYKTSMIGKWHLGDVEPSLPNNMGFEQFYGSLYSNDMKPFAIYRNNNVEIPSPADQTKLTELYTQEAISFVEADAKPFFLYFAHNFPHDPLYVNEQRLGQSNGGLYGDVLEEIDDGIGKLVESLKRSNKLNNTLIVITSDNGPWFLGSPGQTRGRKGNTFEGGMKVPFIAHWPDRISAGRQEKAMAMGIDLLPTVLEILNLPAPEDRAIDGQSMLQTLTEGGPSAHDYLYYIDGNKLISVRGPRFKYRAPEGVFYGTTQMPVAFSMQQKEWLFDLQNDPLESYDTSDKYPEVLSRLRSEYQRKSQEMEANMRGWNKDHTQND